MDQALQRDLPVLVVVDHQTELDLLVQKKNPLARMRPLGVRRSPRHRSAAVPDSMNNMVRERFVQELPTNCISVTVRMLSTM